MTLNWLYNTSNLFKCLNSCKVLVCWVWLTSKPEFSLDIRHTKESLSQSRETEHVIKLWPVMFIQSWRVMQCGWNFHKTLNSLSLFVLFLFFSIILKRKNIYGASPPLFLIGSVGLKVFFYYWNSYYAF